MSMFRVFLVTLLLSISTSSIAESKEIKVCDDNAEWPPYMYYVREDGKPNKSKLTGATNDLLDRIFEISNIGYSTKMLPWKRCLNEVLEGHTFEVFADGSSNEERLKKYHRSNTIYKTTEGLFFSKNRFPDGLNLSSAKDLNKYKLCGISGYNYANYYALGVKEDVDTGVNSASKAFQKLSTDRCDVFLSTVEPIFGAVAIKQFSLGSDINHEALPGGKGTFFYLWISKNSTRATMLVDTINTAIDKLYSNGEADAIYKKYLPGGTAL